MGFNLLRMGFNLLRIGLGCRRVYIYCWLFTPGVLLCIKVIFFSTGQSNCTVGLCVLWTWSRLGFVGRSICINNLHWVDAGPLSSLVLRIFILCQHHVWKHAFKWLEFIQVWHVCCFIYSSWLQNSSSCSIARYMWSVIRQLCLYCICCTLYLNNK